MVHQYILILYQVLLVFIKQLQIYMSVVKQRIRSANAALTDQKPHNKRRYQKVVTETSQEFHKQPQSKIRSYSRDSSKKGRIINTSSMLIKEPEKMIEENMNLKMFINDLQEQLSLQRGRLQMNKRKTQKYVKQFNREFEKEMYYSGKNPHSYMFSGIKQQYQNMKHLYQGKCLEVERYAKTLQITNYQETSIYIETLQDENTSLKEKIDEFYTLKNQNSNFQLKKGQKEQKYSEIDRLYTELHDSQSGLQHERDVKSIEENIYLKSEGRAFQFYKEKCKVNQLQIDELKKKIKFLEQLIIEKDNNEHAAKREKKKINKERNELAAQIQTLKQSIAENKRKYSNQVHTLKQIQAKKSEIQTGILKKALSEKQLHIEKLKKEIGFLTTMLSYWKPLDELNFLGNKEPSENQDYTQSFKLRPNELRKSSAASDRLMAEYPPQVNILQPDNDRSMRSNREEDLFKKASGPRSLSQQNVVGNILKQTKERIPQTCGKKLTSNAKKCRKIQPRQIKQLTELIRYRLIGNKYTVEKVRDLFNLSQVCAQEEKQFRLEYISMREIKAIMLNSPFNLTEEEAILVSRYIVEDEGSEYVYWDEGNQIKRTIAKSIIKTLIGDFTLPNESEVKTQWQKLKIYYLPNIQSALKTIAPKGIISQGKFIELLVGLGIELQDWLKDWMIATMVIQSASLKELNYSILISL